MSGETTRVVPSSAKAGQLVAQRFARAGRENGQGAPAPVEDFADDLLLAGPKFGKAEGFLEQRAGIEGHGNEFNS